MIGLEETVRYCIATVDGWQLSADSVEKVGFEFLGRKVGVRD